MKEGGEMALGKYANKNFYPYELFYNGSAIILLWMPTDSGDVFRMNADNSIAAYQSKNDIKMNQTDAARVKWEEAAFIDFDDFLVVLKSLEPYKQLSTEDCKVLLEGWNFLEDLERTFSPSRSSRLLSNEPLNKVYKKLFYGNNLDAVIPKGQSYYPILEENECLSTIESLCTVWSDLSQKLDKSG